MSAKAQEEEKNKPNFIAKKFFLSLHFNFEKKTFCLFMIQFSPQFCQNNIPSYHPQSRECVIYLNYWLWMSNSIYLNIYYVNLQNLKSTSKLSSKFIAQKFFFWKKTFCLFMIQFSPQLCQNHIPSYHSQSRECVVHLNYWLWMSNSINSNIYYANLQNLKSTSILSSKFDCQFFSFLSISISKKIAYSWFNFLPNFVKIIFPHIILTVENMSCIWIIDFECQNQLIQTFTMQTFKTWNQHQFCLQNFIAKIFFLSLNFNFEKKNCLFMIQFSPQLCQNHIPSYHSQRRECVIHLNYWLWRSNSINSNIFIIF